MIASLHEFLRQLSPGKKKAVMAAGCILAAGFLLLSDRLRQDTKQRTPSDTTQFVQTADAYRDELEIRLKKLLEQLEGVGKTEIMLTVSSSAEQVYAQEVKSSCSERNQQQETSLVRLRNGGTESALVTETHSPEICGAAILCTGGGHAAVRERVAHAAAVLLGIPPARIFVGQYSASY